MQEPVLRSGYGSSFEAVASAIQQDIYRGHLGPGSKLKQIELKHRYGSTRIVLRQALDQLVMKGVILHQPNLGYRVERWDGDRALQLATTRAILETAALESLLPIADSAYLDELERFAEDYRDTYPTLEAAEEVGASRKFHELLLAPCRNRVLVELIFELRTRVPLAVMGHSRDAARLERFKQDKFGLIQALRDGDRHALRQLVWSHLTLDCEHRVA